jgi:hypothetical protein
LKACTAPGSLIRVSPLAIDGHLIFQHRRSGTSRVFLPLCFVNFPPFSCSQPSTAARCALVCFDHSSSLLYRISLDSFLRYPTRSLLFSCSPIAARDFDPFLPSLECRYRRRLQHLPFPFLHRSPITPDFPLGLSSHAIATLAALHHPTQTTVLHKAHHPSDINSSLPSGTLATLDNS